VLAQPLAQRRIHPGLPPRPTRPEGIQYVAIEPHGRGFLVGARWTSPLAGQFDPRTRFRSCRRTFILRDDLSTYPAAIRQPLIPCRRYSSGVKTTEYFDTVRARPDRSTIADDWIQSAIDRPLRQAIQEDGRIRRWALIPGTNDRYLRVILLPDGETVHNAFFDRGFKP
jgi:hypothetical protein